MTDYGDLGDEELEVRKRQITAEQILRSDPSTKWSYGPLTVYHGGEGGSNYLQCRSPSGVSVGLLQFPAYDGWEGLHEDLEDVIEQAREDGYVFGR